MNTRKLTILAGIATLLTLMACVVNTLTQTDTATSLKHQPLMEKDINPAEITQIIFKRKTQTVTINKGKDGWTVDEKHGYPADLDALAQLFIQLQDARIARTLRLSSQQMAQLNLTQQQGMITLHFKNKQGKDMVKLHFGALHQKQQDPRLPDQPTYADGRYMMLNDNTTVLVAQPFNAVDRTPEAWMDKSFVSIGQLKNIALTQQGKTIWQAQRQKKNEDLKLMGTIPPGKRPQTQALQTLKEPFAHLQFQDVADPNEKPENLGMDNPRQLIMTDFNGLTYTFQMGRKLKDRQCLRLLKVTGPTANTTTDNKQLQNTAKAESLTRRYAPWTFQLNAHALNHVDKTRAQLLQDMPPKTANKK